MRSLLVELLYVVPTAMAVTFMLWVLVNLFMQSLRRQSHRR